MVSIRTLESPVSRRKQDHLVAADAGPPVGQRAHRRRVDRNRAAAAIEHDEIVAEAVHFEERDLAHRARLYGGVGTAVQRPLQASGRRLARSGGA